MKTANELMKIVVRQFSNEFFERGTFERGTSPEARKAEDDQLYELELLSLMIRKTVLEARKDGMVTALWEIVR